MITELNDTILCFDCAELVLGLGFAKLYGHDLIETQLDCQQKTHDGIESLCCESCHDEIKDQDSYYTLTVDEEILNEIADRIGEEIGGCTYCEGEERGYFVHAFNNDPHDPDSRMEPSEGISVAEYLYEQGVPEELHQLLCQYIQCVCGHY